MNRIALLVLAISLSACASFQQFNSMNSEDRAAYIAYSDKMTLQQRKEFLARGSTEGRTQYLKELGLYEDYNQQTAFIRLEEERRRDFLKAYLSATPEQIRQFMAAYDEDTQDRIRTKDLQHGWKTEQVVLALGAPADILENPSKGGTANQLWIYEAADPATYLYFKNGSLSNWAR